MSNPTDTIREALKWMPREPLRNEAFASLTELEQQLAAMDEDRARVIRDLHRTRELKQAAEADRDRLRKQAAVAAELARKLQADRDRLQEAKDNWHRSYVLCRQERDDARSEAQTLRDALEQARKVLEAIEEPMHFDDLDAIRDDRVRMQAAARAWLTRDRAALAAPDTPPERCPVCEGIDQPGLTHNPRAPYCTAAPDTPPDADTNLITCQRCGSEVGERDVDYSGCVECREPPDTPPEPPRYEGGSLRRDAPWRDA